MKSGTGDDPFAEDSAEDDASAADAQSESETESGFDDQRPSSTVSGRAGTSAREATGGGSSDTISELPYKYRRDSVKDARTQQPVFLQDSTEDLIDATLDEMEAEFDEDVYKTDVVEAMLVAGAEGSTPAGVLRRWGYGMKNN